MDERPGKCTSLRLAQVLSGPKSQFICGLLSVIGKQVWGPRSVSPKTLGLPSGKVKKASDVLTAVYANDGTIGDAKSSVSSLDCESNSEKPTQGCEALVHWMEQKMEGQGPASDI